MCRPGGCQPSAAGVILPLGSWIQAATHDPTRASALFEIGASDWMPTKRDSLACWRIDSASCGALGGQPFEARNDPAVVWPHRRSISNERRTGARLADR